MKVCLRVDDVGWTDRPIGNGIAKMPDVGLALARQFHAALGGLPWLGGVIPSVLDADGREWLQSAPSGLTIAQHGTTHAVAADGVHSEYRDMSLPLIRHQIAKGRGRLGLPVTHFIPPFNALEPDLPEALYLEGFRVIWGGLSRWPTPPQPHDMGRMLFVPSWAPLYGATRWRMQETDRPLLQVWPEVSDWPGYAVLTLHIPWEAAKDPTFQGVRTLATMIGDVVVAPDEWLQAAYG